MSQDSEQGDFEPLIDTSAGKTPPGKGAGVPPRAGGPGQPPAQQPSVQPRQTRPPAQGLPPGAARPAQGIPQQRPGLQPRPQMQPGQRPVQGQPLQRPAQQIPPGQQRPVQGRPAQQFRPGQQPMPQQRPVQGQPLQRPAQQFPQGQRPAQQPAAAFPQQQGDAASRFRQPLPQKPQSFADSILSSSQKPPESAPTAPAMTPEQKKRKIMIVAGLVMGSLLIAGVVISIVKPSTPGTRADLEKLTKDLAARDAAKVVSDENQQKHDAAVTQFRMNINGGKDTKFEPQIIKALQLIFAADKNVFNDLKQYVYSINKGPKTGFFLMDGIPTIMLDHDTAYRSPTWAATVILHQYFHARQYYEREKARGGMMRPPMLNEDAQVKVEANPMKVDFSDANSIEAFERKADNFALDTMQRVNAPRVELNMLRARPAGEYELTHANSTPTESK